MGEIHAHTSKSEFEMRITTVVPWNSQFKKAPGGQQFIFPFGTKIQKMGGVIKNVLYFFAH